MDSLAAIHEILSKRILLLSGAYFRAMRSPVEKLLESGGQISLPDFERKVDRSAFLSYSQVKSMLPNAMAGDEYDGTEHTHTQPEKRVALIFIDDVMTKYGASCTLSTQRVIGEIQRAEADEDVIALLFYLDSPGGSVWGNRQLAKAVLNAQKPCIGFISEMACSACFWVAQQMDYLLADTDAICSIGSVGVIGIHTEYSEADKMRGVKHTIITDEHSTEKKLGNDVEPLSADDHKKLKTEMDEIKESFVSDIFGGPRGSFIQDEQYMRTAVVLSAKKALEKGWIDAEGTFQDAVNKCFELATDTSQNESSAKDNNSKISTMKFPLLSKIFQGGNDDVKVSFDNEEQAQQVEDTMAAYKSEAKDLKTQLTTANTANTKLTDDLATANARIEELEAMDADEPTTSDNLEGFNPNAGNGAKVKLALRTDI